MNAHTPSPLSYNGHIIADKGDMLSLTDMFNAAKAKHVGNGGDPKDYESRKPSEWLRSADAKRFIEFLADTLGHQVGNSHLVKTSKGATGKKGGETFAHWQIGMAYAKYLDPDFHMWCNTAAREKMEGRVLSSLPDDILELLRRDDGILKQVIHKVTVLQRENVGLCERLEKIEDKITSSSTCSASDIWAHYSFGPLRGGTVWLGNRLMEMGCTPEYGASERHGNQSRRKFDIAKSHIAMKNGLKLHTDRYIAERLGQGKLDLKGK